MNRSATVGHSAPLAVALWAVAACFGLLALADAGSKPGPAAPAPARWPEASSIARATTASTLVVFLHPHCPCSRATVDELRAVLAYRPRLRVVAAFVSPGTVEAGWERTDLWDAVVSLPSTTARVDRDGAEARRFGALTSGDARLYGPDGALRFRGGLTPSRGHVGANPGRDAVLAAAGGEAPANPPAEWPSFGCELLEPERRG